MSISFGGYLDRNDPDQTVIHNQYVAAVNYARAKGTVIAAAGNEHLRIDAGGKVVGHGPLTPPGTAPTDLFDYYGLYETPGCIPGVVDVASTGNVVNTALATCRPNQLRAGNVSCKPSSDAHQPVGVGPQDQLAYYSNYGPRMDVAAPGGARKFNLPVWDRGGTPGFPVSAADGFAAWEDFSITSNYASRATSSRPRGSRPGSATRRSRARRWPRPTPPRSWPSSPALSPPCRATRMASSGS